MNSVIVIDDLNALEFHVRFIFLLTNKLVYVHVIVFGFRIWMDIWDEARRHWVLFKPMLSVLSRGPQSGWIYDGGQQIGNEKFP